MTTATPKEVPRTPLTLEQAVAEAEAVHANGDAEPFCALDHAQLAAWLRELRCQRGVDEVVKTTCEALLFAGHPLIGQVRHILLTALHSDTATALQAAKDLRETLSKRTVP